MRQIVQEVDVTTRRSAAHLILQYGALCRAYGARGRHSEELCDARCGARGALRRHKLNWDVTVNIPKERRRNGEEALAPDPVVPQAPALKRRDMPSTIKEDAPSRKNERVEGKRAPGHLDGHSLGGAAFWRCLAVAVQALGLVLALLSYAVGALAGGRWRKGTSTENGGKKPKLPAAREKAVGDLVVINTTGSGSEEIIPELGEAKAESTSLLPCAAKELRTNRAREEEVGNLVESHSAGSGSDLITQEPEEASAESTDLLPCAGTKNTMLFKLSPVDLSPEARTQPGPETTYTSELTDEPPPHNLRLVRNLLLERMEWAPELHLGATVTVHPWTTGDSEITLAAWCTALGTWSRVPWRATVSA